MRKILSKRATTFSELSLKELHSKITSPVTCNEREKAFGALLRELFPLVVYRCNEFCNSEEVLEDMVQLTMEKIIGGLEKIPPGKFAGDSAYRGYASRIAHNACVDYLRKMACHKNLLLGYPTETTSSVLPLEPDYKIQNILVEEIGQLPPLLREVFLLCAVAGYPLKKISEILGADPSTIRTRFHRAMKKLREALKSLEA